MFVLDTNVVSELRRGKSGKTGSNIVAWAATVAPSELFLSAITVLELEMGIRPPEGMDDDSVLPAFQERVLALDTAVALRCAALDVPDRRSDRDAMIAATALIYAMTLVTRNAADFAPTGVPLLNPREAPDEASGI